MEKATDITLKADEKEYLESIVRTCTSPSQMVQRAKILLLRDKGVPVSIITNILGLSRARVTFYLKKYIDGGAKHAIIDEDRRYRSSKYSDEEKAWIVNIVCQSTNNIRISERIWSCMRLTQYINEKAEEAGYPRLSTISYTSVVTILKHAGINAKNLRYSEQLKQKCLNASGFN